MMMRFRCFGIIWLLCFCFGKSHAQVNDSVFSVSALSSFSLHNISTDDSSDRLLLNKDGNTLLIFLSPDCPLCKNYSSVLNNLRHQYENLVAFHGIIPGNTYTASEIDSFKNAYHIQFPVWVDERKQLSHYMKATVTPEVILLNNKQQLLYKGAIDNWAVSFGKQRQKASQNYLQDAIAQSLRHETVTIKRTQPVGCRINDF